ncbi:hypothetical protein [Bradyrhizobium sp. Arg816]|uniref:hypothetical protein n=1 Tax=Bradyrhizobium sp. Arg816 TaxID=2998491 RepID=UPI00249D93FC|nr:hypothetical protein [Bradyrhizobium sp. Arg816]MDI3566431.1 hypothetical protein [Bradyrhizobium sp. Arg816]
MSVQTMPEPRRVAVSCKWALLAAVVQLSWLSPALAASGCVPLLERTPPLELELFSKDTSRVLAYAQSDDTKLEDKVTSYLATDPELVSVMKNLLIKAPPARHFVIGKAMGRAALHCGAVEPAYARKISAFVGTLRDSDVLAGYTSIDTSNETQPGTIGIAGSKKSGGTALFEGEFGTELANPFAEVPLPQ